MEEVPLIGPAFLTNFDPSNSTSIRNAKSKFPGLIDNLFESGELNKTDLAFSIDVFSAATNASIYHYSHIGENSKKTLTQGKFDDQTIGRIGSVTKLFAVYAIIAKSGIEIFSDPVTKYLPELARNSSGDSLRRIRWDDITVGALASQQAGTGGALGSYLHKRQRSNTNFLQTSWPRTMIPKTQTTTRPKVIETTSSLNVTNSSAQTFSPTFVIRNPPSLLHGGTQSTQMAALPFWARCWRAFPARPSQKQFKRFCSIP